MTACQSQPKNMTEVTRFYDCSFEPVDWESPMNNNRWIANETEALACKLKIRKPGANLLNEEGLYKTKALYLFVIGGGEQWVTAANCKAEIHSDTIKISYTPKYHTGQVGESAPSLICMELEKQSYPEFRKMKIIFEKAHTP